MKFRLYTVEIISFLFIILWVYAGLSKWLDPEFTDQLNKSPYLEGMSGFVAVALPVGELIMAVLLIFPLTKLIGLYLSFFTMFLFSGYIYAMIYYSHYTPCSCGGILSKMDWNTHFLFNIFFMTLAVVAILLWRKPQDGTIGKSAIEKPELFIKNADV